MTKNNWFCKRITEDTIECFLCYANPAGFTQCKTCIHSWCEVCDDNLYQNLHTKCPFCRSPLDHRLSQHELRKKQRMEDILRFLQRLANASRPLFPIIEN